MTLFKKYARAIIVIYDNFKIVFGYNFVDEKIADAVPLAANKP